MPFRRPSRGPDGPQAGTGQPPGDRAFAALWERHREDLHRTAMAIVQDGERAEEALEQARADALTHLRADPTALTRARLHRIVRDAATDRIELFATSRPLAEVDARTALVLHQLGLDPEQITEALALTPAATQALLPAGSARPRPQPQPVTVMPESDRTFEAEPGPVATPPRERRRRPLWRPVAGGGVAVAAAVGALVLSVPGESPAPVAKGATSLGIGPALPRPAADGSGRPDTRSFGLLTSSRESPGRARARASGAALLADASTAGGSDGDPSLIDRVRGGGERTGGSAPTDGGRRGFGAPPGDGPSGGGRAPSTGGGAPSGGDGPSAGGGAPSGGGPSGGGSPAPAPAPAPAAPAAAPAPVPAPAPAPQPGPVQPLVDTTAGTVQRVAGSLLGGG